jgi:hypothetical protein
MSRYSDLFTDRQTRELLSRLKPVPEERCEELRLKYPKLRPDYFDFLREVGYGVIGQRQYMLYGGVSPLSELLTEACDPNWADFLAFGDTIGGTCHAFDPSDGMRVVAIDLDIREVEVIGFSFEGFIRDLLTSFVEESSVQDSNVDGSSP